MYVHVICVFRAYHGTYVVYSSDIVATLSISLSCPLIPMYLHVVGCLHEIYIHVNIIHIYCLWTIWILVCNVVRTCT